MKLLLLAAVLPLPLAAAAADQPHPADWVRVLETGPREEWRAAIESLLALKDLPRQAVATLVRRRDVMDAAVRRRFAAELEGQILRRETLEAAIELVGDPDEKTAKAAARAIGGCEAAFVAPVLAAHLNRHPRRDVIARLLGEFLYEEEVRRRGSEGYHAGHLVDDIARGRRVAEFDVLAPLLADDAPRVRRAGIEALHWLPDARVRVAVFPLTKDAEGETRLAALRALARHGDDRVLAPLLEWADTGEPQQRRWHRNRRFASVGALCRHTRYADLFELYRGARGEEQKADRAALVNGGLELDLIENPQVLAVMETYRSDPDPFLAGVARKVLEWRDRRLHGPGLGAGVLVAFALVSALLGLVLFSWSFRLLGLRRLFASLTPVPIRSLANGHVALSGTVRAESGSKLAHPYTGESCIYYPGADRVRPELRFWLEDETGRVLVDARDLVLLSEDGVLEPGERVFLIGTARRTAEGTVVAKDESPRPLYQRVVHFAVRHVLGGAAKSGSARLLFADPSRCFCLWDDPDDKPFACARDNAALFAAVLLTGVWVCVFALTALALLDQELAVTLKQSLDDLLGASAAPPDANA